MSIKSTYRFQLVLAISLLIPATLVAQSSQYIQNQQTQLQPADFSILGTGQANIFAARFEYQLAGQRILKIGNRNFFAGGDAGLGNSTGTDNAFVGHLAGRFNSSGTFNSFLGTFAGYQNSTGTGNSFVGHQAGYENRDGFENSFFGYYTGYNNTSGRFNVFMGTSAGFSNISGSDNVYIGGSAGRDTTSSSFNVFVGGEAGAFNRFGDANAFFGRQSGYGNTNGSRNAFLGNVAGFANTTGSDNTAIGSRANFASGSLTFATAIGANSVVDQSNMIQLGRFGLDVVRIGVPAGGGTNPLCLDANYTLALCSSSSRYKSEIAKFTPSLSLIRSLQPISFKWHDGTRDIGLVAEDVAKLEPRLAVINAKGEVEGVKYDRIGVLLINVVKEQQAQIETQSKHIDDQQKQIDELKLIVCALQPKARVCMEEKK